MARIKMKKKKKKQRSSLQKLDPKHMIKTCEADKLSTDVAAVEQAIAIPSSFPHDMTISILSCLPVKSLARFRCVNKQCFSLTYDAYFVGEQQKKARDRFPQILSSFIIEKKLMLFSFNVGGDIEDSSFEIGGWTIWSPRLSNSANGLAYAYGVDNFYLLNPSTREYSELPMTPRVALEDESFGFGFDSSSGEYKVVRIFSHEDDDAHCSCVILTVGTAGWRYIGETYPIAFSRPAYVNGHLYWKAFTPKGNGYCMAILSFDVKREKFAVIAAPNPEYWKDRWHIDIKELEGHVCVVAIFRWAKTTVRIWKLMDDSKWVNMYDIELDYGANPLAVETVIGIAGKMLLLEVFNPVGFAVKVFCYDLQKGTLHEILQEAKPKLLIHTESLVSPREVLRNVDA